MVEVTEKMEGLMKTIEEMSVLELSDLVKALEDKFGVSAAVPMAVAAVGPAAAGGEAAEEEKTSFDVILAEIGGQKIQVIKEVRALTELSLKDAKALVDAAPKPVKTGVSKEEADKVKEALEKAGAKAEIK